ncbi:MAG: hypothetical protein M3290_04320 [Actinomycetota bacterium]|nr:hypothetical protein [Actinomycetota bacterium]
MTDHDKEQATEDTDVKDREVPARHPTDGADEGDASSKDEAVEEASEGSFPASDPPAW